MHWLENAMFTLCYISFCLFLFLMLTANMRAGFVHVHAGC